MKKLMKHWMDKKKIDFQIKKQLPVVDEDGNETGEIETKTETIRITVREFMQKFNEHNIVLQETTIMAQRLLAYLYIENPGHYFFEDLHPALKEYAIERSKTIIEDDKKDKEEADVQP